MNDMAAPQETTLMASQTSSDNAAADEFHVLFVLNNLSIGGSEMKTIRLANSLFARGVQVGLAYLNPPHALLTRLHSDIPVWYLARQGKFSLSAAATLRALIREHRPQAVVAVNLYPALYVAMAAARLRPRPRTVGLINTTVFKPGQSWRQGFYRPLLSLLDCSVYGCEAQRCLWLPGGTSMAQRSCVIYNGVDTEQFSGKFRNGGGVDMPERRSRHGIADQAFVIGTVGRLAPEKNQEALIDAVATVRAAGVDMHLLLVGDGPARAALEARAAQLQLQKSVTFTGGLSDVREALALTDVFVLPSRSETFSNAALEAMAMRKPVILTRTGGAAEMITDGVHGFIVGVDELPTRLPELLVQLHADAAMTKRMGIAAAERVQRSFSWDAMVDQYQSLLLPQAEGVHA